MCAGKSSRFKFFPKCLAKIQGVSNLERTCTMLKHLGKDFVVTVNEANKRFFTGYPIIIGKNKKETQRFSNAFPLTEPTIFLYGDVVYSQIDLELILNGKDQTTFYGRYAGNPLTGKPYGELLGLNIIDCERFEEAVKETDRLHSKGRIKRAIGWEVYRVHEGLDPTLNIINENFVELSHYTDDYDSQE